MVKITNITDFIFHSNIFLQICDNLFNGSFPDEQEAVQKVVADVEMYSNLIKQVGKIIKTMGTNYSKFGEPEPVQKI